MIQATLTVNTKPVEEAAQFFDNIQLEMERIGDRVQREIEPTLLSELAYYPGPATHPFVWSTDATKNARARRYYFAAVRRGAIPTQGGRYARTGAYGRSWFLAQQVESGAFALRVGTTYPAARFIGGALNQRSVREAVAWQIPGHATTGWPRQVETVDYWLDVASRMFADEVLTSLEQLVVIEKASRRSSR